MPEEAVLDAAAPIEASTESTVDTSDAGSVSTEGSTSVETIDNADTPQEGEVGHLRGAELYRAVKEKLKSGNLTPQEQRSIRNAIHIAGEADKATNGDLKAFQTEREAYAKLADNPEDGLTPQQRVENVIAERDFWRSFDDKFEKGDPALVDQMAEANPNSFQAVLPSALGKYAELNPEGYSTIIAQGIDGYLQSKEVYLQLALLDRFLPTETNDPATKAVVDAFKAVKDAIGGIQHWAKQPLQAKKVEGAPDKTGKVNETQSLEDREHNITRYEWNVEAATPNQTLRDSEMQRAATARKVTLTDDEKAKVRSAVAKEFNTRLAANTSYGQAMRGYIQNGNKKAYIDRVTSEGRKMLPAIIARHTNSIIDARPKAGSQQKPAQQAAKQPQKAVPATPSNGNQQTQWISGHPKTLNMQIDFNRTTNGMLQRNQAYVKGQKTMVQWKPKTA